jgi:hypothetical protein
LYLRDLSEETFSSFLPSSCIPRKQYTEHAYNYRNIT